MNIIIFINLRKNSIISENLSRHNIFYKYHDLSDMIYTTNDIKLALMDVYDEITTSYDKLLNKIIVFDTIDYIDEMIEIFILDHISKTNDRNKIYLNLISEDQNLTKTKLKMMSMMNENNFKRVLTYLDNEFFLKLRSKDRYFNNVKFLLRSSDDVEDFLDDIELDNIKLISKKKYNTLKKRKKIYIDVISNRMINVKINSIKYDVLSRHIPIKYVDENVLIEKFKKDYKIKYDLRYWQFLLDYVNEYYERKDKIIIIINSKINFSIDGVVEEILESKRDILYFDCDRYCIGKCNLVYYYCLMLNYYGMYNPESNKRLNMNNILNNYNKLQIKNYYDYDSIFDPKIQLIEHTKI